MIYKRTQRLLGLLIVWLGASLLMAPSGSPNGCVGFYTYNQCEAGTTRECFSDARSKVGKGDCKAGKQTCQDNGAWGECKDQVLPKDETCNNKDDNCDGTIDDGDICPQGQVCKKGACVKGTLPPPTPKTFKGSFIGASGHQTSGDIRSTRKNDQETVVLQANFKTDSGPDLKVYLSKDPQGKIDAQETGVLDLGPLKSTSGEQSYPVPSGEKLSSYKSVVIWCKQFSVNFGYATLSTE